MEARRTVETEILESDRSPAASSPQRCCHVSCMQRRVQHGSSYTAEGGWDMLAAGLSTELSTGLSVRSESNKQHNKIPPAVVQKVDQLFVLLLRCTLHKERRGLPKSNTPDNHGVGGVSGGARASGGRLAERFQPLLDAAQPLHFLRRLRACSTPPGHHINVRSHANKHKKKRTSWRA